MRGMKAGDRVTRKYPGYQHREFNGKITDKWPEEVMNGTVISVRRRKGRMVMCDVKPDPPGFGVLFFYASEFTKETT